MVFCHFSHFWDPICPWKTPLPPFLLLLCSPWRNKELEETDLKPKIVSFSINYTCFAVFLYFYGFFSIFQIFMTLLLSQPPLCTLWRNKKFMETNTRQEIISFTKNVACFASFLFLSGFCHFSQFLTLITPRGALKHYPILFHGPLKGLVVR